MMPETMRRAAGMPLLDVSGLIQLHDEGVRAWHVDEPSGERRLAAAALGIVSPPDLAAALAREHIVNIRLWHEEDEARRRDVADAVIAGVKRRIDVHNQERNDLIERIDESILAALGPPAATAPLHSETPGSILDRLSILALKIYHMRVEAERADAVEDHRARCRERLAVLEEQRNDLAACLEALLADVAAGRRRFRVYRQFKMYNDPELNPALRGPRR